MTIANSPKINANNYPDWQALYTNIQKNVANKIPGIANEEINRNSAVIRNMYVDISSIDDKLQAWQSQGATSLCIYADVVRIPANYIYKPFKNTFILIAARRIEVGEGAILRLDYRDTKAAAFRIYTNEMVGTLEVVADAKVQRNTYEISPVDFAQKSEFNDITKGVEISWQHGESTSAKNLIYSIEEIWQWESCHLKLALTSIFLFASLFFYSNRDIARSMLEWVRFCTADSENMMEMFLQSSSLLATLQASSKHATFVPYLSKDVYEKQVDLFIQAAKEYEQQYQRLFDKNEVIDANKEESKLSESYYQDTTKFVNDLIQQSQKNFEQIDNSVKNITKKLKEQSEIVREAEITFKAGLKEWEYEQKRNAAFQIISAIFEFTVAIGTIVVGGVATAVTGGAAAPAAGAAVVGATASATAAAAAVSTAAQASSSLAKIMEKLKSLMEALEEIYKIAQAISTVAQAITTASKDLENAQSQVDELKQIDISTQEEDISASAYWTQFRLEVDNQLEDAIQIGIRGAKEYKMALYTMAMYGQSLAEKKCDFIRISQELVRLKLQKPVSEKQQQRIQDYLQRLDNNKKPSTEIMLVLYQQQLNIKRSLFIAIENYRLAYRYWALQDSLVQPSLTKDVASLYEDLSNIKSEFSDALEKFKPKKPSEFEDKYCEISFDSNPQALEYFRKNGEIVFPISLEEPEFAYYDRVRVNEIRVWLEGAKPKNPKDSIYIKITTSGEEYSDRYKEQTYKFAGEPVDTLFEYCVKNAFSSKSDWSFDDGKIGDVKTTTKINDELKHAYVLPPVFCDWKISLLSPEKIDFSNVSKITMEFKGSYIARY